MSFTRFTACNNGEDAVKQQWEQSPGQSPQDRARPDAKTTGTCVYLASFAALLSLTVVLLGMVYFCPSRGFNGDSEEISAYLFGILTWMDRPGEEDRQE